MPWRKYPPKQGKYGPSYIVCRGVQVRKDHRKMWVLHIYVNGDRTNRTIGEGREGLAKAIKAAEAVAIRLRTAPGTLDIERSSKPRQSVPSFNEFSRVWFEENKTRWDELTCERYETILRLHVWPFEIFDKKLTDVSRREIKKHLRKVFNRRASATVEAVHAAISGVFEEAVDDELVGANPARGLLKKVLPPKNQRNKTDPTPFTVKELQRFLAKAQEIVSWTELLILKMMAYAGLRLGEALSVRLRNIDFERMTLHVAESYKTNRFKKPKFGKTRLVDLPDYLVQELSVYVVSLRKELLKSGQGGQVDRLFVDPLENGPWPYSQRKIQGLMRKVCDRAGLERRHPHDLRHTYATILLMAHQSPGYVQKQLGHSSISITMDIYCHWIPGEGRKELEKALLGDRSAQKVVPNLHIFAYKQKRLQ